MVKQMMMRLTVLTVAMVWCIQAGAQLPPGFKDFEVASGSISSSPVYLTPFNGRLYFFANDGSTGRELFTVQGAGIPALVKNMAPAATNTISIGYIQPAAGMNGKFYFTAENGSSGEELYAYDGTNQPVLVADLTFGPDSSMPDNYTVLNNNLYFTATTAADGLELYRYTGTSTPLRVTDINPGADSSVFGPMVAYNNKLYFVGRTAANGSELWSYDPVADTAILEADIDTGAASSNPANLTVLNGKLYFSATTFSFGRELYEYDGTTATRLTDISASGLSSLIPVRKNAFALFMGKVYFSGRDTSGERHLWAYDPATSNVTLVHKINANGDANPRELVVHNNRLFICANDGTHGYELFAYDGTNAPVLVGDLCNGTGSSLPEELTSIGDELYFSANDCNLAGQDLFSYNDKRVGIASVTTAPIRIYPNPAGNVLYVDVPQGATAHATVFNATGQVVSGAAVAPGSNTIDVSALPQGLYYLQLKGGEVSGTAKFVKQ